MGEEKVFEGTKLPPQGRRVLSIDTFNLLRKCKTVFSPLWLSICLHPPKMIFYSFITTVLFFLLSKFLQAALKSSDLVLQVRGTPVPLTAYNRLLTSVSCNPPFKDLSLFLHQEGHGGARCTTTAHRGENRWRRMNGFGMSRRASDVLGWDDVHRRPCGGAEVRTPPWGGSPREGTG